MGVRNGIDIGYIVEKIKRNWLILAGSIILSGLIALGLIYIQPKKYKIVTSLKVDNSTNNAIVENLFEGVKLIEEKTNSSNEIAVLKSFDLVHLALEKIDYKIDFYHKENLFYREIKDTSPFTVMLEKEFDQLIDIPVFITIVDQNRYKISIEFSKAEVFNYETGRATRYMQEAHFEKTLIFDEKIDEPYLKLTITKNSNETYHPGDQFYFILRNTNTLTEEYCHRLHIAPISKDASILELSIESENPEREINFIDKLIHLYIQRNLSSKNKITDRIINFIDNQLADISDSLHTAEMDLQKFRSSSKVIDTDYESKNLYDELKSIDKQKSDELIKFKYYEYLGEYVKNNNDFNDILAPSVMGIHDPTLNELINTLSDYMAQKTAISYSAKELNPKFNILQENIENTRRAILENVQNIKVSSEIKLNDINERLNKAQREFNALPENERILLNAQRKFEFNDNIYNYFLQKRGEAAIIKESNIPAEIIIDQARIEGTKPVSPDKKTIFVVLLGAGLFIPLGLILAHDLFTTKVLHPQDLLTQEKFKLPLLEEIPKNKKSDAKKNNGLSKACEESFRALKLKIENLQENKIIALSSLIKGDGKSFCAGHLAKTFCHSGNKVLIIDLNVDNPTLLQELFSKEKAISNTLKGNELNAHTIETHFPDLHLLVFENTGSSLKNRLSRDRLNHLLHQLAPAFDYIIIDCPAIKESASFISVADLTNLNLFVIRRNHSPADFSKLQALSGSQDTHKNQFLFNGAL